MSINDLWFCNMQLEKNKIKEVYRKDGTVNYSQKQKERSIISGTQAEEKEAG